MENQAAEPAPPGQQSNLTDPHSQSYLEIITVVTCLACTTPLVWVRIYVGLFVMRRVDWDDILLFLSWLLWIGYSAIGLEFIRHGAFIDTWNLTMSKYQDWHRWAYISELTYLILLLAVKTAVLALYQRVFFAKTGTPFWLKWMTIGFIIFNTLSYTAVIILQGLTCVPRQKIWDSSIPGHCVGEYAVIFGSSTWNVLSDLFIVCVPMAIVLRLQMPRKRKAEVLFIFAFGILGFISSIIRLIYSILSVTDTNETVADMRIGLWTYAEISSCFLASCVPMFPRFLHHVRQKFLRSEKETPKPPLPLQYAQRSNKESKLSTVRSIFPPRNRRHTEEEDPYLITSVSFLDSEADGVNMVFNEAHIDSVTTSSTKSVAKAYATSDRPNSSRSQLENFSQLAACNSRMSSAADIHYSVEIKPFEH